MAICQYDPVRRTKVKKRPKKMVTNTMLVRSAQIKYNNDNNPMKSKKKPRRRMSISDALASARGFHSH